MLVYQSHLESKWFKSLGVSHYLILAIRKEARVLKNDERDVVIVVKVNY